jgi:hypothetical protein
VNKLYKNVRKQISQKNGVPKGIRTPVTAVKGRCPRPLDDGDYRGGARRDRTADLLHAMQALSQLSYSPTMFANFKVESDFCQALSSGIIAIAFLIRSIVLSLPVHANVKSIDGDIDPPVIATRSG